jgi:diacylglycerol kinase (ATP)
VRLLEESGARVTVCDDEDAAVGSGADRIAVASGDGGIAPAAAAAGRAGMSLAVLPVGTANDFARGAGLPARLDEAVPLAARGAALRRLDLGRMDGRPFVNAASLGLAAAAGEAATGMKRVLGPLSYLLGALWSGFSGRPVRCVAELDGQPFFSGRAWQVTVAGTGSFGAGSDLGVADMADGRLDVAVMEAGSRMRLVRYGYALRSGRLTSQPGVRHREAAEVRLELPAPATLNVDGELVEAGPAIAFTVERQAFALVVPDQPGGNSPSQ